MTKLCLSCATAELEPLLETALLPVSNDYHAVSGQPRARFSLRPAVCLSCGLVQLLDPPAPEIVRPRSAPVLYNEPESHLDAVVADLQKLPRVSPMTRFIGLTYKEDTTLERLSRLGYGNLYRFKLREDYGLVDPAAGLETVQEVVCSEQFSRAIAAHGPAEVIIARHVLEHAHDPLRFLSQLSNNLAPNGYLVFEVPDCSRALALLDYATLWEEHISYFTPLTLGNLFRSAGLAVVSMRVHPQPYEDSIVAIVQKGATSSATNSSAIMIAPTKGDSLEVDREVQQAQRFGGSFRSWQAGTRAFIEKNASNGCYLFGAGHLATTFVHLAGIQPFITAALDDAPDKVGKALPGTSIPIRQSDTLLSASGALCLLSLNPANESRIIERFAGFEERQGRFRSIFPSSKRALHTLPTA